MQWMTKRTKEKKNPNIKDDEQKLSKNELERQTQSIAKNEETNDEKKWDDPCKNARHDS